MKDKRFPLDPKKPSPFIVIPDVPPFHPRPKEPWRSPSDLPLPDEGPMKTEPPHIPHTKGK